MLVRCIVGIVSKGGRKKKNVKIGILVYFVMLTYHNHFL